MHALYLDLLSLKCIMLQLAWYGNSMTVRIFGYIYIILGCVLQSCCGVSLVIYIGMDGHGRSSTACYINQFLDDAELHTIGLYHQQFTAEAYTWYM